MASASVELPARSLGLRVARAPVRFAIAASDRFPRCEAQINLRTDALLPMLRPEVWRLRRLGYSFTRNRLFDTWGERIDERHLTGFMSVRPEGEKRRPCTMLYRTTAVLADGTITACGCGDLTGQSDLALGNIRDTPLLAAWQDGRMERLRQRFADGDLPDLCRGCRQYQPVAAERSPR
jgi:radical SAM protein with 4Fe4S-binding SPASM domain